MHEESSLRLLRYSSEGLVSVLCVVVAAFAVVLECRLRRVWFSRGERGIKENAEAGGEGGGW